MKISFSSTKQQSIILTISLFLISSGLISLFTWPIILNDLLTLRPNSKLFNYWQKLPIMIPTELYFFNWINPEDVYSSSVKPRFEEIGPFRFWQSEEKSNVTWNSNGTVTFKHLRYWYYDQEASTVDLDSNITTIDVVSLATARATKHWSVFIQKTTSYTLMNLGHYLPLTSTPRQLLFEGYPDIFVNALTIWPFYKTHWLDYWEKVGFFYQRNGSSEYEGVFNMGTGVNSSLGVLYNWNYQDGTSFFDGNCKQVTGTTGQLYERNLKKDRVVIFSPDFGRYITLKFAEEHWVDGILGYKFVLEDLTLDNGTIYPENRCFCGGECIPSGMLNLSKTRHDIPLFVSLPHFFKADPFYLEAIEGLKPDKDKHEFFVTIDPITGIPLEFDVKIQLNLLVESTPGWKIYENLPRRYLPVFWCQNKSKMSQEILYLLRTLHFMQTLSIYSGILMVIIGLMLGMWMVYEKYHRKKKINFYQRQELRKKKNFNDKT